jgi:hypothetical protein
MERFKFCKVAIRTLLRGNVGFGLFGDFVQRLSLAKLNFDRVALCPWSSFLTAERQSRITLLRVALRL